MSDSKTSVVPHNIDSTPEAGRDPLRIMIEIAKDENLTTDDKSKL